MKKNQLFVYLATIISATPLYATEALATRLSGYWCAVKNQDFLYEKRDLPKE
jgi:hypothetical protein